MRIRVKSIVRRTIIVDAEPSDTIRTLKEKIQAVECIPADQLRLINVSGVMENDKTLAEYKIENNAVLYGHCIPEQCLLSNRQDEQPLAKRRRKT